MTFLSHEHPFHTTQQSTLENTFISLQNIKHFKYTYIPLFAPQTMQKPFIYIKGFLICLTCSLKLTLDLAKPLVTHPGICDTGKIEGIFPNYLKCSLLRLLRSYVFIFKASVIKGIQLV